MAASDTNDTNSSPNSSFQPAPNAARPSWESAPPPAPSRRPEAAPPRAALPPSSPFDAPPASYAPPAPAPAPAYGASPDSEVKYDLAGNPIPGSGQSVSPAPPGQMGYSAGTPAGAWPPAPTSSYGYGSSENGTDRVAKLKWNWGAFLIPFWWSVFNGQKGIAGIVALLNVASRWIPAPYDWGVSIGSLGVMIYLGVMGHRLAWSSDRFGGDYDNFIRTQRAWMVWGFIVTGAIIGVVLVAAALIPGLLAGFTGSHPPAHTYGTGYGGYNSSPGSSPGHVHNSGQ